jgi:hypothetical protein
MEPMYYIGLDVHKQKISYCVKDSGGKLCAEGWIPATRHDLDCWMKNLPQPWSAAMEATMFTGWIYDYLKPHAASAENSACPDAAGHCCCEKEERPYRRQPNLRLSALRFSARVSLISYQHHLPNADLYQMVLHRPVECTRQIGT